MAKTDSIHTARWLEQLSQQNWDIHLYSSNYTSKYQYEIKNVTRDRSRAAQKIKKTQLRTFSGWQLYWRKGLNFLRRTRDRFMPDAASQQLCRLINKIRPDILHSLEFQSAGYLTSRAKELYQGDFPVWVATNWGSDIFWFNQFKEHQKKIKDILKNCDYYAAECARDICLAEDNGLKAKTLPVLPNSGGLDLAKIKPWRKPLKERKIIMLRGKLGSWGRGLVGLEALRLCAEQLADYQIYIYSGFNHPEMERAVYDFQRTTGLKVKLLDGNVSHDKILQLHGRARISIALSASDGISTSFLEAMAMGSFPIQSNTSCADEWIEDKKTGMLVPADNPEIVAKAIKLALTQDRLVLEAAQQNWQIAKKRLDAVMIQKKVINSYQAIQKAKKNIKTNQNTIDSRPEALNWPKFIWSGVVQLVLASYIILTLLLWVFINIDTQIQWVTTNRKIPAVLRTLVDQTHIWIYSNQFAATFIYRTQQ